MVIMLRDLLCEVKLYYFLFNFDNGLILGLSPLVIIHYKVQVFLFREAIRKIDFSFIKCIHL